MANIETGNNGRGLKNKLQKKILRVDFTPMVDMNMLLITFFMFCTTLSMPQVMDIAMPTDEGETPVPESKSLTLILGENDRIYYYDGIANYEDYTSLKSMDATELRDVLVERNTYALHKISELRQKRTQKQLSEDDYKKQVSEIKKEKSGLIVMIKPTADSNYKNLVDALDEMQICGVGKYTIVDMSEGDKFVLENYKTKGALTAQVSK